MKLQPLIIPWYHWLSYFAYGIHFVYHKQNMEVYGIMEWLKFLFHFTTKQWMEYV